MINFLTLQATQQKKALLTNLLLAVPEHLNSIDVYVHSGELSDVSYLHPAAEGMLIPG